VRCLQLTVPGRTAGGAGDGWGWRLAARALRSAHAPGPGHVVVAATPLWAPLLQHVPADRRCFDAVDDWRELPSMQASRRRVDAGYRSLGACDTVTAVSAELSDRLARDVGVAAVTVPNGVDLCRYAGPAPAPDGLPDGRFAVYVGQVQERVDLDLLAATARRVPVVVAGGASPGAAAVLADLPLTWLGPVDVDLVPGLLQRATVGLLPHRVDRLTRSMDPMKLLEYLAAGLSVVATDLPGVAVSPRVHVTADLASDFAAEVERRLAEPRGTAPDDAVRGRDWSVVADRLLGLCAGTP
jgi:teichuronic acid biosynthesis glycosyltransferase TuaH